MWLLESVLRERGSPCCCCCCLLLPPDWASSSHLILPHGSHMLRLVQQQERRNVDPWHWSDSLSWTTSWDFFYKREKQTFLWFDLLSFDIFCHSQQKPSLTDTPYVRWLIAIIIAMNLLLLPHHVMKCFLAFPPWSAIKPFNYHSFTAVICYKSPRIFTGSLTSRIDKVRREALG